jgi:hypothetical protein
MKTVLTQLCVLKALQPRLADMADDKWEDIDEKALSALQLSLSPGVLRECKIYDIIVEEIEGAIYDQESC